MADGEGLTHIDGAGSAHMVDVGEKSVTRREAEARGCVRMNPETLQAIKTGDMKKGDVIGTARLAGSMAAKRTHDLIPLCHALSLSSVEVDLEPDHDLPGYRISATARLSAQTGVEMEALTAVSVACLTLYDMAKAIDKTMVIGDIHLHRKSGGRSGDWTAPLD